MRKILLILALVLFCIVVVLLFIANKKSDVLKLQGDLFIKSNKLEEALLYYEEANNIFPFRRDIKDDIDSTKLLINSQNEYGAIADAEFAEVQNEPALNNAPPVTLTKGQYFVPILMYHHIRINPKPEDPLWAQLNVAPDLLDSELKYLATNNYNVITLDDLYNALNNTGKLPSKPIVLTFDDGYENFYQNGYPLIKKYKMKAAVFIITQVTEAPAYMSWGQIIEMDKSGFIQIEAHSEHHPFLTNLTADMANKEISGSKFDLESHLSHPVNWFAYPYGDYNNFVVSLVQKAGFIGALTTNYGAVQEKDKLFVLPRIMIDGRFTLDEFIQRIQQ